MFDLLSCFKQELSTPAPSALADLLKTTPDAIKAFDQAYREMAIDADASVTGNAMDDMSRPKAGIGHIEAGQVKALVERIALNLAEQTDIISVDDVGTMRYRYKPPNSEEKTSDEMAMTKDVSRTELLTIPEQIRPQLTGSLMTVDTKGPSYPALLEMCQMSKTAKTEKQRIEGYNLFRQGLDILDLDPVLYEMLGRNQNSMSHWLPEIAAANREYGFFHIPRTIIAKVPITLLQLSRLEYGSLTPSSKAIVNNWATRVFALEESQDYFIKTGTFSSKFDFRNARVTHGQEVTELGEYLLFIQNQAVNMAGPLMHPCIYGVSTTNEWVVREYIEDVENNPTIYKGLPLHTEYRVFVDFDTDEVIGVTPYWRPDVMKARFAKGTQNSPHDYHDYVVYQAHESTLMHRYSENVATVVQEIKKLFPHVMLDGQWSIDVMQNGDTFWIIDMAQAHSSAMNDVVPNLKKQPENWLPSAE